MRERERKRERTGGKVEDVEYSVEMRRKERNSIINRGEIRK